MSPSNPGSWQCHEWYLPKRSLSSQRILRSSLPSVCLLVAKLMRCQESGANIQSQYAAFLLIPAPTSCPRPCKKPALEGGQLPRAEQEQGGRCWLPEGGTFGPLDASGCSHRQAAPSPESGNTTCCSSGLHPSTRLALGLLSTISTCLKDTAGDDLCHVFISPK